METSRKIEALSALFAAGVFAGSLLPDGGSAPYLWASILFSALAALLYFTRKDSGFLPPCLCLFLCGALCFLTSSFAVPVREHPLRDLADTACGVLKERIDALPFRKSETAALLKALLTGDRSSLAKETVAVFRKAGASHLLALSGLHIGILYLLLGYVLAPVGHSPAARTGKSLLTVLLAWFYALMTGASPSILRATLFITIRETAGLLHRKRDPLKVLSLALVLQLAFSPSAIRSVGFQLSYAAMLGIFLIHPWLSSFYPSAGKRPDPVRKIWEAASLSLSCQVTTAPIVWICFRSFPVYFLITNLIAIPLTTLLVGTSVALLLLSFAGICPDAAVRLTEGLADALLGALRVIASM
ncbi:MAG: ComEC/Rec2 family competence protein [Bacteroidales bacterium]|nr:ComEC/Rec2 family competence protein [Bacteroidales bacterium]